MIATNRQDNTLLRWLRVLSVVILGSALLLPPFVVKEGLPKVEVSDLLFPFLFLNLLLFLRTETGRKGLHFLRSIKVHLSLFVAFLVCIVISIAWNQRFSVLRDWFEFIKFAKFIALFVGFLIAFKPAEFRRLLLFFFLPVIVFNLAHYFDLFGFNNHVEGWYAPDVHLDLFGLDSQGNPATKRLLGTMGNPNVNALMFLFFLVTFLPLSHPTVRSKSLKYYKLAAFVAIFGVMLSQSRTGLGALILVLLLYGLYVKDRRRDFLMYAAYTGLAFFMMDLIGNEYLTTVVDGDRLKHSKEGRMTQWLKILDAMEGKWIFGNAPYKEFFESNDIYSESEYFLILFRYGFVGLGVYLVWWGAHLIKVLKTKQFARFVVAAVPAIFFVAATTNNPMHANKLAVLIAFVLAYSVLSGNSKHAET